jgi:hypothetical protein
VTRLPRQEPANIIDANIIMRSRGEAYPARFLDRTKAVSFPCVYITWRFTRPRGEFRDFKNWATRCAMGFSYRRFPSAASHVTNNAVDIIYGHNIILNEGYKALIPTIVNLSALIMWLVEIHACRSFVCND